jgi:type IV pilus assembly protein PilM
VDASLGITGSAVLYKTIEMPADLTDDQLETAIRDGADQYVPYPLNEIALAYEIKRRSPVNAGQLEVLLTACRKENVSLRQTVLERAGLRAKVVDIEAYCMDRVYRIMTESLGIGDDAVTAVFSIGATISQLFVMTRDRPPYCRDQLFGGLQLTQEIQRRYDLSFEQAESAKRVSGLPDDYGNEVHRPWVETIVEQLSRQLDFIYASSPWDAVDHVILCGGVFCGGVGATTGVEDAVTSALKLPTTIANPFADMDLAAGVDSDLLSVDAPAMMIACGLALRSVTTQRSDAVARDRSRTIRLPEAIDDDTTDE